MTSEENFLSLLYEQYRIPMWKYAMSIVHDEHLAGDAVQDAFLKLFPKVPVLHDMGESAIHAYIARTVHNAAVDTIKKARAITYLESVELLAGSGQAVSTQGMEGYTEIKLLIEQLPVIYREAVCLRLLYGMDYKDIAGTLGISRLNAQKRVSRGRKLLRAQLSPGRGETK